MLRIDILSLFPTMFDGVFNNSIIKRARDAHLLETVVTDFREFSTLKHKNVDDTPYGGGSGMVLMAEPIARAVEKVKEYPATKRRTLLLSPEGVIFTQEKAKELATFDQLIMISGHYEGFDARVGILADEVISIGDFVLTGGELAAMVLTDAVARMIPGVLGSLDSAMTDSFYNGLLGYPQYTRPREFRGEKVPEVLLSGDHSKIAKWRREQSLLLTKKHRPDLLAKLLLEGRLSTADLDFLQLHNFRE